MRALCVYRHQPRATARHPPSQTHEHMFARTHARTHTRMHMCASQCCAAQGWEQGDLRGGAGRPTGQGPAAVQIHLGGCGPHQCHREGYTVREHTVVQCTRQCQGGGCTASEREDHPAEPHRKHAGQARMCASGPCWAAEAQQGPHPASTRGPACPPQPTVQGKAVCEAFCKSSLGKAHAHVCDAPSDWPGHTGTHKRTGTSTHTITQTPP